MPDPSRKKRPLPTKLEINVQSSPAFSDTEEGLPTSPISLLSPQSNAMIEPPMMQNVPQSTSYNLTTQDVQVHIDVRKPLAIAKKVNNKKKNCNKDAIQKAKDSNHHMNMNAQKGSKPYTGDIEDQPPQNQKMENQQTEKSKEDKFFYGILSKKQGVFMNCLRLIFAIVFIPFIVLFLVWGMIDNIWEKCAKCCDCDCDCCNCCDSENICESCLEVACERCAGCIASSCDNC